MSKVLLLTWRITSVIMGYMNYTSVITSKGTITIPAEIRTKLGIKPGMAVVISDPEAGSTVITLKRQQTWQEIRQRHQDILRKKGLTFQPTPNGAGFEAMVQERYGNL